MILAMAALMLTIGCGVEEDGDEDFDDGEDLESITSEYRLARSMRDFKFPFRGVKNNYHRGEIWKITQGYYSGLHRNTYYRDGAAKHSIDLVRDDGGRTLYSAVLAPADGKVIFANKLNGYGWCVIMDHGNGYKSIVAHLDQNPTRFVRVGYKLLQGTLIGECGASGGNWIEHIHFSVWKNNISQDLNGISGGPGLTVGGRYRSGNGFVNPPHGW